MWCFIDESWHKGDKEHVGVLAAAVGPRTDFEELGRFLYRIRKKYYGEEHARNLRSELKGTSLFSNASFRQYDAGFSKNLLVARETIEWAAQSNIRLIGVSIYGETEPKLLTPDLKSLSTPFRELCVRILSHVPTGQAGHMVFDQRLGAQGDICIAVHNYLAGIKDNNRIIPYPLIGVSNVLPGLQLADIAAYVLGKYSIGDARFEFFYRKLKALQTEGIDHRGHRVFGYLRLQWHGDDKYSVRKIRTKK